jgi:hypothetical protein
MNKTEILEQWLKEQIHKEESSGAEMFLGVPDKWYEPVHLCCINGHVSHRYLKSEAKGGNVCMSCFEPVYICPDITEDELSKILNKHS